MVYRISPQQTTKLIRRMPGRIVDRLRVKLYVPIEKFRRDVPFIDLFQLVPISDSNESLFDQPSPPIFLHLGFRKRFAPT